MEPRFQPWLNLYIRNYNHIKSIQSENVAIKIVREKVTDDSLGQRFQKQNLNRIRTSLRAVVCRIRTRVKSRCHTISQNWLKIDMQTLFGVFSKEQVTLGSNSSCFGNYRHGRVLGASDRCHIGYTSMYHMLRRTNMLLPYRTDLCILYTFNNNTNLFIYSALFNVLSDQKRITTINNRKTIQILEVYKYI